MADFDFDFDLDFDYEVSRLLNVSLYDHITSIRSYARHHYPSVGHAFATPPGRKYAYVSAAAADNALSQQVRLFE